MIIYKPFEMHTHTFHSDGRFTLEQLCDTAKHYGYEGIALTDHNTTSGFDGLPETPVIHGIPVIRGIEWTTFFGHMQALYAEKFVDWRRAKPDTIDEFTARIKAADGIVGVVHPFEMGSPMCTGCYFDFKVKNWDLIDYIEVWSKGNPTERYETPLSLKMWTDLLNEGHRITITAGRDWHWDDPAKHSAATYIGLENGVVSAETIRDAFRCGRIYLTCGPKMDIQGEQDGKVFLIGETIHPGSCRLSVRLDRTSRENAWKAFGIIPHELRIVSNGETILSAECGQGDLFELDFSVQKGWFRLEMWGNALGKEGKQIGLSSAFYCQ
ncbi:MAG: CehA/McbA family metallohydrolase [Flexilinea sp.]|nr:CehA/McbA family metallohydrolase [Flexilinea sp.]